MLSRMMVAINSGFGWDVPCLSGLIYFHFSAVVGKTEWLNNKLAPFGISGPSEKSWIYYLLCYKPTLSGVDTGFPVGGVHQPLGGVPTYKFAGFSQKLHEIKKFLVHRGLVHWGHPPWIPPLIINKHSRF